MGFTDEWAAQVFSRNADRWCPQADKLASAIANASPAFTSFTGVSALPEIDFNTLKTQLRATWMLGDFGIIARYTAKSAEEFVSHLPIQHGARVLDVACGTGNTAIPEARAGALVTGVDMLRICLSRHGSAPRRRD